MTKDHPMHRLILSIFYIFLSTDLWAACSAPTANAGALDWKGDKFQYCDGSTWKDFGGSGSGAVADINDIGNVDTTGVSTDHILYNNGTHWVSIDMQNFLDRFQIMSYVPKVYCWGNGNHGKLGNGSGASSNIPSPLSTGGSWRMISTGESHTCGIRTDGKLLCWGRGDFGQLGNNSTSTEYIPKEVHNGGVWKFVTAGKAHSCGIKQDDSLWCWGSGHQGRLGTSGSASYNIPTAVYGTGWTWKTVHAREDYTCGIRTNGSLWCWGNGNDGKLGHGSQTDKSSPTPVSGNSLWTSVSTGEKHACGIKQDDSLWCWGKNNLGQLGKGDQSGAYIPQQVTGGSNWKSVSIGSEHTCGIKTDDSLWCWGRGYENQLGVGNTGTFQVAPRALFAGTTWKEISVFDNTSCGIQTDNSLSCWGQHRLGHPTINSSASMLQIDGGGQWQSVYGSYYHVCGLKRE